MSIDFREEGNTDLELRFEFPVKQYSDIEKALVETGRANPVFEYGIYLTDGTLCSSVKNTVAIRPKGYTTKASAKRN